MTVRVLYLCEGSSDKELKLHIEGIAAEEGRKITVTEPEWDRVTPSPRHSVAGMLRAAHRLSNGKSAYDLAVIHRDSDDGPPERRREEITRAVSGECPDLAHVPLVPVRMLEAWLLLDESAIRDVAGNPNGRVPLRLPKPSRAESLADPKQALREAIATASEERGRGLNRLQKRFSANRRRLIQMLDRQGPVCRLQSWQAFSTELREALRTF